MSALRIIAECIGWACITLWLLGSLNLIDFHVCIKDAGKCQHPGGGK